MTTEGDILARVRTLTDTYPANHLEEFLGCLGIAAAAADRLGEDSRRYHDEIKSVLFGVAWARDREMSLLMSLYDAAIKYGKEMMVNGQNWRGQLELLESYRTLLS